MFDFQQFQSQTQRDQKIDWIVGGFQGTPQQWHTWMKPKGKSFLSITVLGPGGNGGTGAIGANSAAAGGGGGASGGFTRCIIPTFQLPDVLYYSIPGQNSGAGMRTIVSLEPVDSITTTLVYANGGGNGGNASGATAGTAGTAAASAAFTAAYMMGMFSILSPFILPGVAGGAGNSTAAGGNVNFPNTGSPLCPGAGGAGLGAAASTGSTGGTVFVSTTSKWFPSLSGSGSQSVSTSPARNGLDGTQLDNEQIFRFYGGSGGGATHGSATGGGLVQSNGGNGSIGSGGGGQGGALTGSTPGSIGLGGPGAILFIAF